MKLIKDHKDQARFAKWFKIIWISFGISLLISLSDFIYVIFIRHELFNKAPTIAVLIFLLFFILAGLSFLLAMFLLVLKDLSGKNKITISKVVLACLILPVLPIYFFLKPFFNKSQKIYTKIFTSIFFLILTIPIWSLGYVVLYFGSTDELFLGTRYQVTALAETSSMSPSFSGGSIGKYYPYKNIFYKIDKNWAYKFQRGDVVTFSNLITQEYLKKLGNDYSSGFIKRIVALSGDTIELRGGVLFLNGQPIVEPYTQEPNTTFGLDYQWARDNGLSGLFQQDCQKIVVPSHKLFVLGDNRKNSTDSRTIGFVDFDDINGYFPFEDQKKPYYEGVTLMNHSSNWRDTSSDLSSEILFKISTSCKK